MQEWKNNNTKESIKYKDWYVTVQKDINTWETRPIETKDRLFVIGIISIILVFLSPFIRGFINIFNDIFRNSILAWGILWILIILMISLAVRKVRKIINLSNAVECWTVLKKMVKIIDFEYFTSDDNSWYYIIFSDWEKKYKSSYHKWAKIFNKKGKELKNYNFKHKKQYLEQCHLHSQKWDFYIGDKDIVLIDPNDANNYILESESKW